MRHRQKTVKLGRTAEHRNAMLANQVCSLIEHQRIKTTLAKAKALRPLAEKMVTLGKKNTVHARRIALATLHQKDAVKKLFDDVAPRSTDRQGGYTRIIKLGQRKSDAAAMAFIEWVDTVAHSDDVTETSKPAKAAARKPAAKKEPAKSTVPAEPVQEEAAENEPTEPPAEPKEPTSSEETSPAAEPKPQAEDKKP